MKKSIAFLLAVILVVSLAACGGGGSSQAPASSTAPVGDAPAPSGDAPAADGDLAGLDPVNLTIYSPGNENSVPTKTIIEYARLVEEASGGQITFNVHHSNELGDDAESIESTRMGTIDVIFAGTSGFTSFYEPAKVLDLPFLFDSAEEAYEIVNGEIGEKIFADFENFGLVYLSEGDNGMRHISTTNRQINTADDVKGLKIRVPTSEMYLDCWEALGATPVALALTELSIALSNGTAEAQDNATYHLVANATYDDIKYFSNINYMWMGCTMAVNANVWHSLPAEYQAIMKEQAIAAAKYSFDTIAADNKDATAFLENEGVEFNYSPDVQSFKDALGGEEYYKRYEGQAWYNQDIIDAILAK